MPNDIIAEAQKCLKCKNPRCMQACPVHTPVNEFMQLVLDNKVHEAGELLFANNPLSVVCSLVCPHEIQCEGNCVLGIKGTPVGVSKVEQYISDFYLNFPEKLQIAEKKQKVAIIGSGPAGLTIAFILAQKGYDITIFEANEKIGGVLRYGIPEFRLPKAVLEKIKTKLLLQGIKIRPNTLIGRTITIDHLFRDGYKAVFIGTGVWRPYTLNIKGESLGNVHFAIDYLRNPEAYTLGQRVCIIGGGNSAIDVARTAIRNGSRSVTIMYYKSEDKLSALKHEVNYAKIDGVKFEFFTSPVEFVDEGVKFIRMEAVQDEAGNTKYAEIKNSEGLFEADSIIVAISQGPRDYIISGTTGLNANPNGLLVTNDHGATTRDGVFAGGDVVTGAKTVVEAVRWSKSVAKAMEEYLCHLE